MPVMGENTGLNDLRHNGSDVGTDPRWETACWPMSARPPPETLAFFVRGVWGGGPSEIGKSTLSMSTSTPSTLTELALRPERCSARPRTPDDPALRGGGDPYDGFTGQDISAVSRTTPRPTPCLFNPAALCLSLTPASTVAQVVSLGLPEAPAARDVALRCLVQKTNPVSYRGLQECVILSD